MSNGTAPDAIIQIDGLTKRFAAQRNYRALLRFRRQETLTAVDQVTLTIHAGEVFGLLGPNGAGKTTLVKMLCSLILPTDGRASIAGHDVVAEAAAVRRTIGLIDAQERSFFWRLTGRQNLQFFAALYDLHGLVATRRIAEVLDLVGLERHADRRFMDYSSGMRQKLAIARGLLPMPPVLFMDEPTRSLDPVSAYELRIFIRTTLVKRMQRTIVLVTHRLEEAEELCGRVAIMNHGRIIACGPVADIKQQVTARQRYCLRVQNLSPDTLAGLDQLPGVVQVHLDSDALQGHTITLLLSDESTALPDVVRWIVHYGGDLQHCHVETPSLEEAFMHLVRGADGL